MPATLPTAMKRIGAIVESPALFPTMTGRENLRLLGAIDRIGARRVDSVLELVGLAGRADDLVRKYSLGMRQRLGLAAALLKDPALLILDEPANGLDPTGIRQVRELLQQLGRDGRTVFASSHLLVEIEHTCDSVAILHRGRCVAEGIMASAGHAGLVVRVDDLAAGLDAPRRAGLRVERGDGHLRIALDPGLAGEVTRILAAEQLCVTELRPEERTLIAYFGIVSIAAAVSFSRRDIAGAS